MVALILCVPNAILETPIRFSCTITDLLLFAGQHKTRTNKRMIKFSTNVAPVCFGQISNACLVCPFLLYLVLLPTSTAFVSIYFYVPKKYGLWQVLLGLKCGGQPHHIIWEQCGQVNDSDKKQN